MTNPERIVSTVADEYGLTLAQMNARSRDAYLVDARRDAAVRLWHETDLTLNEIGLLLGGRTYSTVIHMLRTFDLRRRDL